MVGLVGPLEEWYRDDGPAARVQQLLPSAHLAGGCQGVLCEVMRPIHLNRDPLRCKHESGLPAITEDLEHILVDLGFVGLCVLALLLRFARVGAIGMTIALHRLAGEQSTDGPPFSAV